MKIGINPCLQFYKGKLSKEEELRLLCMYSIIYKMTDEETVAFGMMASKGAGKELSCTFTFDEIRECRATLLSEHKTLKCTSIRELSEYDKDMCYLCPYHTSYKNYRYKKERKYLCLIVTSKVPIGNNLKTLLSKTGGKRKLDTFFSSYTYLDISGERICIPLYAYIAEFYISQPLLVGSMDKKEVSKQLLSYLVGKITEECLTLDVTELETLLKKEINTVHACDVKHITADEIAVLYDELIKPVTYSSTEEYKSLIVELKGLPKLSEAWVDGKHVKVDTNQQTNTGADNDVSAGTDNTDKSDTSVKAATSDVKTSDKSFTGIVNQTEAEKIGSIQADNKQTENVVTNNIVAEGATAPSSLDGSSSSAKAESNKRVEDAMAMMMAFMNAASADGVTPSTLNDLIGDVGETVYTVGDDKGEVAEKIAADEEFADYKDSKEHTDDTNNVCDTYCANDIGNEENAGGAGNTDDVSENADNETKTNAMVDEALENNMSVTGSSEGMDCSQTESHFVDSADESVERMSFDTEEEMAYLSQEEQEKIYKSREKLSAIPNLDADLVAFAPEHFIQSLEENGYKEFSSMFDKAPNLLFGDEDVLEEAPVSASSCDTNVFCMEKDAYAEDRSCVYEEDFVEVCVNKSKSGTRNMAGKGVNDLNNSEDGVNPAVNINNLLSFSLAAGMGALENTSDNDSDTVSKSDNGSEFDEISDFLVSDDKNDAKTKKGSKKGKNEAKNDTFDENNVDNKTDYTKNETFYPQNHKIRYNQKEVIRYSTENYLLFNKLLEKASLVSMEAVTMVFDKGEENYGLLIYLEGKFFFMEPGRVPLRALRRLLHSDALIITLHSAELYQMFTKYRIEVHYLRLQDLLYMYVSLHQAKCLEDDNLHLVSVFKELSKERIAPSGRFYLKAMPLYGKVFEDIDTYVVHEKYKVYDSYLRMSYYCSFSLDTSDILTEKMMYQRCGLYAIKSCLKKDVHPIIPGTCYYFTVLGGGHDKEKIKEFYRKALWKLQDGKSFYLGKVRILYIGERGLFLFAKETNNMTYEMLQYAFVHAARIMDLQQVPTIKMVKEIYEYEE